MKRKTPADPRFSLILAEDHPLVAAAIIALLKNEFYIIAHVRDGPSAVSSTLRLQPDILLLNVGLPHLNGIDAATYILREWPEARIVFLTGQSRQDYMQEAFRAGALGYVLKHSSPSELVETLRAVCRQHHHPPTNQNLSRPEIFECLTLRQRELLHRLSEGHTSRAVAQQMNVSLKTIEFHKVCMLRRLKMKNTAQLIAFVAAGGLFELPVPTLPNRTAPTVLINNFLEHS